MEKTARPFTNRAGLSSRILNCLDQSFPPPHPQLAACVVIPAKNEAERLEATLDALRRQVDLHGRPLQPEHWEALLLINNSDDDSAAMARRFAQSNPGFALHVAERRFESEQAHIGHVRKLLMDCACARLLLHARPQSLILSTDADTEVASDWVARNWAEAQQGAEAIGGRISLRVSDLRELDARTREIQRWDDTYHLLIAWLEDRCDPLPHDPWPRHHQHFGGSFAVRPEIYRRVGGLPPKDTLEDVAFYEALVRQDVKFRHSPDVCVHTAGRLDGRTSVGLAEQLSSWSKGSSTVDVPSACFYRKLFSLRKRLRVLWTQRQTEERWSDYHLENLASECGTPVPELQQALAANWFGAAFELLDLPGKLQRGLLDGPPVEPLQQAVHELQREYRATNGEREFSIEEAQSDIGSP